MGKILKLAVFLAVISGLSGLMLSYVNDLTAPIIEQQQIAAVQESLSVLYGEGETFEPVDAKLPEETAITSIYSVNKDGAVAGYVYQCAVQGYGDEVTFMVGINTDGTYQGFVPINYSGETSGFGSRIADSEFTSQFDASSIDDGVDTLSGATITSGAVVDGVNEAVEHFNANYR